MLDKSFRPGQNLTARDMQRIVSGINANPIASENQNTGHQVVELISNCDVGKTALVQGGYYSGSDFVVNTSLPQFSAFNIGPASANDGDHVALHWGDAVGTLPFFSRGGGYFKVKRFDWLKQHADGVGGYTDSALRDQAYCFAGDVNHEADAVRDTYICLMTFGIDDSNLSVPISPAANFICMGSGRYVNSGGYDSIISAAYPFYAEWINAAGSGYSNYGTQAFFTLSAIRTQYNPTSVTYTEITSGTYAKTSVGQSPIVSGYSDAAVDDSYCYAKTGHSFKYTSWPPVAGAVIHGLLMTCYNSAYPRDTKAWAQELDTYILGVT